MGHRKIRHRASIEGMKSTILHPHWCVLHKTSSLVQKEPGKGKFATGNENQLLSIDPKQQHPVKSIIETCAVLWASPTLQDFSCKRIINNQSSIIISISSLIESRSKIASHPSRAWLISSLASCCRERGSGSNPPLLIEISSSNSPQRASMIQSVKFSHLYTSDTSEFPQTVEMTGYRGPFNPEKAGPK